MHALEVRARSFGEDDGFLVGGGAGDVAGGGGGHAVGELACGEVYAATISVT